MKTDGGEMRVMTQGNHVVRRISACSAVVNNLVPHSER